MLRAFRAATLIRHHPMYFNFAWLRCFLLHVFDLPASVERSKDIKNNRKAHSKEAELVLQWPPTSTITKDWK